MVRARALTKSFGDLEVLRGIDLEVPAGQTTAVIGPSGSGKSTLLRCINYLEAPTSGSVEIDGEPLCLGPGASRWQRERYLNAMRTKVGMVFQRFNLFPHRTALGNVMEGLLIVRRLAREAAAERGMAMLRRVGLEETEILSVGSGRSLIDVHGSENLASRGLKTEAETACAAEEVDYTEAPRIRQRH